MNMICKQCGASFDSHNTGMNPNCCKSCNDNYIDSGSAGEEWKPAPIKIPEEFILEGSISINGRRQTWPHATISYEQIMRLCGNDPQLIFTVTFFRGGHDQRQEGCLSPGQYIQVLPGALISCVDTSRA